MQKIILGLPIDLDEVYAEMQFSLKNNKVVSASAKNQKAEVIRKEVWAEVEVELLQFDEINFAEI